MGFLGMLISIQPALQGTTPPAPPPKSPYRNPLHRMLRADAMLPATIGVGKLIWSQDEHPVISYSNKSPLWVIEEIKTSSINILIPLGVKLPPELPTIMEDPNVVGAIVGLTAPHQPGETVHIYEQCCTAGEWLHGTSMHAFFGHAGKWSEKAMEQAALPNINLMMKYKEVIMNGPEPSKKLKRVLLADKLEDRIIYQWMRIQDLSEKGGSIYNDQGIVFNANGKIIDEMRQLYQLSLKTATAPGRDSGDDGDDESDKSPNLSPQQSDPPPHNLNNGSGNRNQCNSIGRCPVHLDRGPPGELDDGGNGGNGGNKNSHNSHWSSGNGRTSNHNINSWRGYSVRPAVHRGTTHLV